MNPQLLFFVWLRATEQVTREFFTPFGRTEMNIIPNAEPKVGAPRVTIDDIKRKITKAEYVRHGRMTFCVLTLQNGFLVTGESSCVSEENYNQALGEKIAYDNAFDKVWLLEGYLLRERLMLGLGTDWK